MTAIERVRELLDERGVGWWNQTDPEPQTVTMARLGEQLIEYHENVNGTMGYHVWNMCDLTPEQAIAATLGMQDLQAENAKLRGLVRDYERCTMHADCSRCEYDGKLSTHCPLSPCFPDADELRELGVEVE